MNSLPHSRHLRGDCRYSGLDLVMENLWVCNGVREVGLCTLPRTLWNCNPSPLQPLYDAIVRGVLAAGNGYFRDWDGNSGEICVHG
jgi:hypothetical protein